MLESSSFLFARNMEDLVIFVADELDVIVQLDVVVVLALLFLVVMALAEIEGAFVAEAVLCFFPVVAVVVGVVDAMCVCWR